MDSYQKMQYRSKAMSLPDEQLVGEAVGHLRDAKGAMSQAAWSGNLQAYDIFKDELTLRAERTGNRESLDSLQAKIKEEFTPTISKEKE